MAWTANTAFSTVLDEFYDSGFDYIRDDGKEARAKRWVNQSYQELCGLEKWPFLYTTITGPAPKALPNLGQILSVVDTVEDSRLVETDESFLADIDPELTETAQSSFYYLTMVSEVPTLNVWPVSTNNLSIHYFQSPNELSADADELIVPNQFIDVVVLGAVRRGMMDGTDTQAQVQLVSQELQGRIDSMRKSILPKPQYQNIQFYSEDW